MTDLDERWVAWSRNLFRSLADGGVWGIPSDGLIFQRQGDKLVLTLVMPHDDAMPVSAEELTESQENLYELVASYFRAAGIEVERVGQ